MKKTKRPDAFDRAIARLIDGCRLGPGPTPEQETERREAEKVIADFERDHPELAVRENARLGREEQEIRRRIFGRGQQPKKDPRK